MSTSGYTLAQLKRGFFDRAGVQDQLGRRAATAMSQFGAFVMTRAQRSIRSGGKSGIVSKPGEPPRYHTRGPASLRDGILFAYDPARGSVVIGPVALNQVSIVRSMGRGGPSPSAWGMMKGAIPAVLEYGGTVGVREIWDATKNNGQGEWRRVPLSYRLRTSRRIPIWRATDAERRASIDRVHVKVGRRSITYTVVPIEAAKQRVRDVTIAPRPYMAPAFYGVLGEKGMDRAFRGIVGTRGLVAMGSGQNSVMLNTAV